MLRLSWEALSPARTEIEEEVGSLMKVEHRPSCRGDRASERLPTNPIKLTVLHFWKWQSGKKA